MVPPPPQSPALLVPVALSLVAGSATAVGGAAVYFTRGTPGPPLIAACLAFAAGVMTTVSLFDLYLPAAAAAPLSATLSLLVGAVLTRCLAALPIPEPQDVALAWRGVGVLRGGDDCATSSGADGQQGGSGSGGGGVGLGIRVPGGGRDVEGGEGGSGGGSSGGLAGTNSSGRAAVGTPASEGGHGVESWSDGGGASPAPVAFGSGAGSKASSTGVSLTGGGGVSVRVGAAGGGSAPSTPALALPLVPTTAAAGTTAAGPPSTSIVAPPVLPLASTAPPPTSSKGRSTSAWRLGFLLAVVLTLHNLPEGVAVGLGAMKSHDLGVVLSAAMYVLLVAAATGAGVVSRFTPSPPHPAQLCAQCGGRRGGGGASIRRHG